ncbi:MAG: Rap1a/Tai family immunity protein [Candidatus Desulfacyla sp.]
MKQRWMMVVLMGIFLIPGWVGAVDKDDFVVDTTGDLMALCTACESDPLHKEAVHFCMGFLVGSYHYHVVATMGSDGKRLVCPPDPPPPRAEVATRFVDWVKKHPEYLNEEPVDTWFRFLIETYPCKN